jgi:RNA polymerase sigma-70 factor (sigma-E family)
MEQESEAAFTAFVRAASPGLLRTAYLLTGDRGDAEDLVQVTLVRVSRRFTAADPRPLAYARQVLVNLVHDRRRHWRRRPAEMLGEAPEPRVADPWADPAEAFAVRDELLGAVRRLPLRQRAVLVLRYFDDLPVEEVAAVLGCTPGTVKSQTHKALRTLRASVSLPAEEVRHACR